MRIMFVQAGLGAGGAEKIVNLLAGHYHELGHEVSVLALTGEAEKSFFPYGPDIRIVCMKDGASGSRGYSRRLREIRWLRSQIRSLKPDIIISFLTKVNLLAALATVGTGVPLVVSERNNPDRQLAGSAWRILNRFTVLRADRLVMQTDGAAASLGAKATSRISVIPNPCTFRETRKPDTYGAPEFIGVGRLDEQKGFHHLITAFSTVSHEIPEASLKIFGEGNERPRLEALVSELGLSGKVALPGNTGTPGAWASEGNIFVLSSRFEGFPNVLVEAMSAGYPVIAFDCPWGPSDILSDPGHGLLVPDGDVDALAAAMLRLAISKKERAAFAAAAPAAVAGFALDDVLDKWDDIVFGMLSADNGKPINGPAGHTILPSHSGPKT